MDDELKTRDELIRELHILRGCNRELEEAAVDTAQIVSELRETAGRLCMLFETAKDAILLVDAETGMISDVNRAMIDMSGCPRDELVGKTLWEIAPLKDLDAGLITFRELKEQDYIRYDDLPFKTKGNEPLNVEFACSLHPADDGRIIQCTIRDITSRRRLEDNLWKVESRFKALFHACRHRYRDHGPGRRHCRE